MYSIAGYQEMVFDAVRMDAYAAALRRAIKPGAIVVDIGSGTGIASLLACRFGAAKVYSIEPDDAIHVAIENAVANGFENRIEFIQDLSTNIQIPQRADVIVSDLRGVLPLLTQHLPSIIHARQHLLAKDGIMIPQCDRIWVTLAELPSRLSSDPGKKKNWDPAEFGLKFAAADRFLANSMCKTQIEANQMLSDSTLLAELDYGTIASPNLTGNANLTVTRNGRATGIVAWFSTTLLGDIGFSNAPGQPPAIYGRMLFPLTQTIDVFQGDQVQIQIRATLTSSDYVWQWDTRIHSQDAEMPPRADFHQSSFFAQPVSVTRLRKLSSNFVPSLNKQGTIDSLVISAIAERQSLGEIASELTAKFPEKFVSWESALTHVGSLAERYSD